MITQEEAVAIAWERVSDPSNGHRFTFQKSPRRVELDDHRFGHEALSSENPFWGVIFDYDLPDGTTVHPKFVHVVVDQESGRSEFLPLK
jgi:hypothetical protein